MQKYFQKKSNHYITINFRYFYRTGLENGDCEERKEELRGAVVYGTVGR